MTKVITYIFVAILLEVNCETNEVYKKGFYPGRIKPGKYEYPENNGWMLPRDAAKICENGMAIK